MGRTKTVVDNEAMNLIHNFFLEECAGSAKKLKLPAAAAYIAKNGYPSYRVEMLRRNDTLRQYIESLVTADNQKKARVLAIYKTLDVEAFLNKNTTRASLKKALTELDGYYKLLADSASEVNKQHKSLAEKLERAQDDLVEIQSQLSAQIQALCEAKHEINRLKSDNQALRRVVDDYLYPNIAKELLAKEGVLSNTETIIASEKLENNIITPSTIINIRSGSKVVKDLFDSLKD